MGVWVTERCCYCGRIIHYTIGEMKSCSVILCKQKHEQDHWYNIGMKEIEDFLKE